MKTFDQSRYHYFVLLPEVLYAKESPNAPFNAGQTIQHIGTLSFRNYTDRTGVFGVKGAAVEYVTSVDKYNQPKGKNFSVGFSTNAIVVADGDTDIKGKTMFDFIKNSPFCEGSPNGTYVKGPDGEMIQTNVKFRLMDNEADAKNALEATVLQNEAISKALALDYETLSEVAILGIGQSEPKSKESLLRHSVVEWAKKRPKAFLEILDNGDRPLRASIRKGLSEGILTQKGSLIYWGSTLIGSDENDAVAKIMNDEDLYAALKEKSNLKLPEQKAKKKKVA